MMPQTKREPVVIDGADHWVCSKCSEPKLPAEFYRSANRWNGINSSCKACDKKCRIYTTDPVKIQLRRNKRNGHYAENRAAFDKYNKKYYSTPEQAGKQKRRVAAYFKNNPEKKRSKDAVSNAVRSGRLIKPARCERCGTPTPRERLHGHHHDYSKPLDVEWLCRLCHGKHHRKECK